MSNHTFQIEERRRQVASLLSQSYNETEIARHLGVDQSTISKDIKALREMSRQFVFDLAKGDLGYYYKKSLDGIEEAKKQAWRMFNDVDNPLTNKEKLLALKVVIIAEESRFKLLSEGPSVMTMQSLEDRLQRVEQAS
jgi:IS30 family transposase